MMANVDDVGNILTSLGIEKHHIVPTNVSQRSLRQHSKFNQFESKIPYFPLEWFDCDEKFFAGTHSTEGVYVLYCVQNLFSRSNVNCNTHQQNLA